VPVRGNGDQGLVHTGFGRVGPESGPWRWLRLLFSLIWFAYLAQPLASLSDTRHGTVWIAAAVAVTAAFCVVYVVVVISWDRRV
jgi:peptidoglycan/LPS O-acetylase OafA/YrhL